MAADFKFLLDVKTSRAPVDFPCVDNPSINREPSYRAVVESLSIKAVRKKKGKEFFQQGLAIACDEWIMALSLLGLFLEAAAVVEIS